MDDGKICNASIKVTVSHVTWLTYVRHDVSMWDTTHSCETCQVMTWLQVMSHMNESCLVSHVTWHMSQVMSHIRDTTHSCETSHVSHKWVTSHVMWDTTHACETRTWWMHCVSTLRPNVWSHDYSFRISFFKKRFLFFWWFVAFARSGTMCHMVTLFGFPFFKKKHIFLGAIHCVSTLKHNVSYDDSFRISFLKNILPLARSDTIFGHMITLSGFFLFFLCFIAVARSGAMFFYMMTLFGFLFFKKNLFFWWFIALARSGGFCMCSRCVLPRSVEMKPRRLRL